ncbi:LysR family transcriptional regulator [Exilibacterium tricleocarpae]|uniref:LysR family transcriptional regulator n=1 Tax=Exilibacterium tricleocarpae TaxID=2591008 RepID=A0A545T616_9GAMM|nr:LysR family transcriptional regulator [Exilibacterium tricleocarpae]TQV72628.1 LysR family transcriptional regulator [Exilibacterium tricleocarpae]
MDTRRVARLDLNLLVALQVLLEERNVSKAAERLFVTQSAMSKTLGRLRDMFGDPLFTRTSHGMVPTPRAKELQASLLEILQGVEQLVSARAFDPRNFKGEFTIAVAEYLGIGILPALMEILQREAPHIRIQTISRIENQLDQLAEGNLDFALHIQRTRYGADFNVTHLGGMPPVLLARQGHPLRQQGAITWKDISAYPQISLYIPDIEELEFMRQTRGVFAEHEQQLEDVFETSHLFTAMEVLRRTDCLMPGPPFLSQHPQISGGVVGLPLPLDTAVKINYMLVSHKRTDNSPAHQWLQQKILEIVETFSKERKRRLEDARHAYQTDQLVGVLRSGY